MCFSPQWRAIFRHLNFQKWSKHAVFCTFWLANVLFATAACNFWFLLWAPTSAPAALTGLLFDWPDTRIIEKTQHFATSLTFGADVSSFFWLSRYCIFCRLTWRLYCWAMHLLFNCPYCRKFLFKLPSTIRDGLHSSYCVSSLFSSAERLFSLLKFAVCCDLRRTAERRRMKSLVFHKDLLTSWVGVPWNRLVNDNLVSESNYSHISHNQQWILLDWRCSWRCLHKSNRNSCVIQEALKWIYLSSSVEGSGALTLLSLRHVPSFQSEACFPNKKKWPPTGLARLLSENREQGASIMRRR